MILNFLCVVILIFVTLFFSTSCDSSCLIKKEKETKQKLYSQLNVGDSKERVFKAIKNMDIEFTFDNSQNRYQATVRGCGKYEAVSVLIFLDDTNHLSKIEIFKSYTGV